MCGQGLPLPHLVGSSMGQPIAASIITQRMVRTGMELKLNTTLYTGTWGLYRFGKPHEALIPRMPLRGSGSSDRLPVYTIL